MLGSLIGEAYLSHPKFYVAVDCVIFGYEEGKLKLLVYPRRFEPSYHSWSLMGGFVQEKETMDEAALRVLKLTVGLKDIYLEQLGGFSDPQRDPGARVISMAYYALVRLSEHDTKFIEKNGAKWCAIDELPELVFDHQQMVDKALERLQLKATYNLIGSELLPKFFTLTDMINLYNAVFQRTFDQGNFRKKITKLNILEKTTIKETNSSKRGAFYYKFKQNLNHDNYDRIVKN